MSLIPTGINIGGAVGRLTGVGRNLWLAGVGAVAEVTEAGRDTFDRLVERGKPVEEKQRQMVQKVTGRATQTVREAGKLVQDTVEHESRGVLKRLNVMTRDDVKVLSSRLNSLSKKVDEVVARRQAATAGVIEIVTPEGEAAAIVIPETPAAAARARKTAAPRATRARKASR
ncbi:MAG TPA: phasin family protein [Thermoanaerobaculia bacterium]